VCLKMKNKVLVIGLDGATWDVIMPYVDQGEMPNIKKLMDSGSWGNLSTVPGKIFPFYEAYQSATAWVSFMTGTTPEKHGVFWFTKKPKNGDPLWWWKKNGDLVSSRDIRVPKIWDILSKKNKKSIVINIPMTYPVQKLNGWMITGFMTPPGKQFTGVHYPIRIQELCQELSKSRL
jgi:predicted AlkP superfamily phosphohydrolase/phosphomutase